ARLKAVNRPRLHRDYVWSAGRHAGKFVKMTASSDKRFALIAPITGPSGPRGGAAWADLKRVGRKHMKRLSLYLLAMAGLLAVASTAHAATRYDGSWDLVFVTQRGACDASYNFTVNISNGIVTHPNLVKFRGYVAKSGAVRASVTVPDKYASGSGRLSSNSGRGTWSGYSGSARCSGYWTAERN